MYPPFNHTPNRITRWASSIHPPLLPSAIPSNIPARINNHIAGYLNSPTPTWRAVQKAKAAGVFLVYYYEPEDQYIHFASNGLPVHDQHYFNGDAPFFLGDGEGVGVEGEGGEETGVGGMWVKGEEGIGEEVAEDRDGEDRVNGGVGTEEKAVGKEGGSAVSESLRGKDGCKLAGAGVHYGVDWKGAFNITHFSMMASGGVALEELPESGIWEDEWDAFFK